MMEKLFILHYHEIALKGKNRKFFEDKLLFNIKRTLTGEDFDLVKKISGRLILKLNDKSNTEKIRNKLAKVFGIAYFCQAYSSPQKLEILQKDVLELMKYKVTVTFGDSHRKRRHSERSEESQSLILQTRRSFGPDESGLQDDVFSVTFKIQTQRSNKDYPLTSQEINEKIGAYVLKNYGHRESIVVDLEKPDLTCFIEIVEKFAFIYFEKIKGAGGLPAGTAGKVISLLSCGFDSPVASYFMARRGAEIIFVHFESTPQTSQASIENVRNLVRKLVEYQGKSKLYLVPFLEIQKEIIKNCQNDLAVVLYRRLMVRIACEIAKKEKAKALVTGDNLGQVASQTLENIEVISKASDFPIFRPLIGFDKEEIINFAKKISTYEISSRPYEDCCSLFVPPHPQTKAKLGEVKREEGKMDVDKLISEALKETRIEEICL